MVELLKRLDEEKVDRHPDGTAPVGVAAEKGGGGLSRLVIHTIDTAVDISFVGMIEVVAQKGAHPVGREKFRFVEHARKDSLELLAVDKGKQPPHTARRALRHFDVFRNVGMIVDEPLHAPLEAGKAIDDFRFKRFDGEEGDQADHGADLEEVALAVRKVQHVVVEAVLLVPEGNAAGTEVVHGTSDVDKVLEEF